MDGFKKHLANIGVDVNSIPAPPEGVAFNDWVWKLASDGKIYSEKLGKLKLSQKENNSDKKRREEAEAERRKLLSEMPHGFQLAANLMLHLKQIVEFRRKTGRIYRQPDEAERCIQKCRECPDNKSVVDDRGSLRCVLCGCHVVEVAGIDELGKAHFEALHCDNGHW